jgi:murein DD-endopeptidase MepM/ murein hydrolase activator NlpD
MKKVTLVVIPGDSSAAKHFTIPKALMDIVFFSGIMVFCLAGYFVFDYFQLRHFKHSYYKLTRENEGLKGEAQLLATNLDEVKKSLNQVQEYSAKLTEITQIKAKKFTTKTGIGPLSEAEEKSFRENDSPVTEPQNYMPLGVNMDKLVFQPVFDRLSLVGQRANQSALKLQHLLSTLSQQKSLLSSIPSINPVDGWITSGFGSRISPFTGERAVHKGIDVASPIGTPIYAPADGVVIFIGAKEGFGNFVMVAHGYGVVSGYGHNAENLVQAGQRVKRGDQIATVGMSGRTTGPHLHYEVLVNGLNVDPRKFILDSF